MSQGIASKNLYDLLGNDPELDPERATPQPPTQAIDKPLARTGKRNAPAEAPVRAAGSAPGTSQRDNKSSHEKNFRDRGVGSEANRQRGTGELPEGEGHRGRGGRGVPAGRGFGRGGRGAARGDRHSRSNIVDHDKQVAHGWGGQDGISELNDEKAGEAIAKADEKEDGIVADTQESTEPAAEEEPEDKSKSYVEYLAELAERKLKIAAQEVRKANEGSKQKFPEGKEVTRQEEEDFMAGSGGKAKRERERKQKEFVALDDAKLHREAESSGFRGGRGGRGRGDRGDRGGFRGEGRGRGEFRGRGEGRGRGGRGEGRGGQGGPRGGRGGQSGPTPNLNDTSAFPSLGA